MSSAHLGIGGALALAAVVCPQAGCVVDECEATSECAAGEVCVDGTLGLECVAGTACTSEFDCAAGETCKITPPSEPDHPFESGRSAVGICECASLAGCSSETSTDTGTLVITPGTTASTTNTTSTTTTTETGAGGAGGSGGAASGGGGGA